MHEIWTEKRKFPKAFNGNFKQQQKHFYRCEFGKSRLKIYCIPCNGIVTISVSNVVVNTLIECIVDPKKNEMKSKEKHSFTTFYCFTHPRAHTTMLDFSCLLCIDAWLLLLHLSFCSKHLDLLQMIHTHKKWYFYYFSWFFFLLLFVVGLVEKLS